MKLLKSMETVRRRLLTQLALVVVAFLGGCTAIAKLTAPDLSGRPENSALIVVSCEAKTHGIFRITTSQEVVGGSLRKTDDGRLFEGDADSDSGLIVFSKLPPGEYRLATVLANWQGGENTEMNAYDVPPGSAAGVIMTVGLGEARFLGLVTVDEISTTKEQGVRFGLKPTPKVEREAWDDFARLYSWSPWIGIIRKRQSELGRK